MSGCYVPCLPNPNPPSFLTFVGFIGIIFCPFLIIMRLLFHIKQPMNYHQQSTYHHQRFQFIINQQSLPTYLLDAFCNHWDFCLLPRLLQHLDSHQSPSTISFAIQHLNLFQSLPNFHHILECTSHTPGDTLLVNDLGASAGLTPFKSDFFDYVKCSIPVQDISKVIVHTKRLICLPTTSGLSFTIIQGLPFQSSSLSSVLWRKEHYFWRSS